MTVWKHARLLMLASIALTGIACATKKAERILDDLDRSCLQAGMFDSAMAIELANQQLSSGRPTPRGLRDVRERQSAATFRYARCEELITLKNQVYSAAGLALDPGTSEITVTGLWFGRHAELESKLNSSLVKIRNHQRRGEGEFLDIEKEVSTVADEASRMSAFFENWVRTFGVIALLGVLLVRVALRASNRKHWVTFSHLAAIWPWSSSKFLLSSTLLRFGWFIIVTALGVATMPHFAWL